MKKFLAIFLLTMISTVIIFVVTSFSLYLYYPLELKTYDLRVLLRTRTYEHDKIVIVDIDDYSIKKLGRFHNWPRYYYASVINYLNTEKAKVIGMDILFPEADSLTHSLIALYQKKKHEWLEND